MTKMVEPKNKNTTKSKNSKKKIEKNEKNDVKQSVKNDASNKNPSENKNNSTIETKNENSSTVIAIVLIIILIGIFIFVIYYSRTSPQSKIVQEEYNGYTFFQDKAGHWVTVVKTVNGDTEIPFYFHPSDLENLEYDMKINQHISNVQNNDGKLVIAFGSELTNPDLEGKGSQTVAAYEIIKTGINVFGMPVETALTENINGSNFTISNCSMSSRDSFVIEMHLGNESRVYYKDNCAIIEAVNLTDTIKLADQLVFKIMGILPPN